MTERYPFRMILGAGLLFASACSGPEARVAPASDEERTSYALGVHLGQRLLQMQADLDPAEITAGLRAGIHVEQPTGLTDLPWNAETIRLELASLAATTRDGTLRWREAAAGRNIEAGRQFLTANRERDDVVELPGGIQYRIVEPGDAPPPAVEDRVTLEYEGRLLDGAVFDTSADRTVPTIVRLTRTLPAWQEVLPRIGVGGTVEMWIPGDESAATRPFELADPGEVVAFTVKIVSVDRYASAARPRAPGL